jgi:hypothetical protein
MKRSKATAVEFEGVILPKGTRSAKLAKKGISNTDEMGKFLTAVFSDTLKGKILLPPPNSPIRVSSKMLKGLEQKLRQGSPMKIQPMESDPKKTIRPRTKQRKESIRSG